LPRNKTEVRNFVCTVCKGELVLDDRNESVNFCNEPLDVVDKFCYLGDTISAGGGAEAATIARIRCGWGKFRELMPILTMKRFPLLLKGKVYDACVRSAMTYASETWPVKMDDINRMERNEMRMVRWMCGVKLQDRITSQELRRRLGIKSIRDVMCTSRLGWYGHVQRMDEQNWVKKCMSLIVGGAAPRGRPRKTWDQTVRTDLESKNLTSEAALNRAAWNAAIRTRD
jgi:hypothetical protein